MVHNVPVHISPVSDPLSKSNFPRWRLRTQSLLDHYGLLEIVIGEESRPIENTPTELTHRYLRRDQQAYDLLISVLSDVDLIAISKNPSIQTSRAIWTHFLYSYGNFGSIDANEAWTRYYECGSDINDPNLFLNLQLAVSQLEQAGQPIDAEYCVAFLVAKFPPSLHLLRQKFFCREVQLTWRKAFEHLESATQKFRQSSLCSENVHTSTSVNLGASAPPPPVRSNGPSTNLPPDVSFQNHQDEATCNNAANQATTKRVTPHLTSSSFKLEAARTSGLSSAGNTRKHIARKNITHTTTHPVPLFKDSTFSFRVDLGSTEPSFRIDSDVRGAKDDVAASISQIPSGGRFPGSSHSTDQKPQQAFGLKTAKVSSPFTKTVSQAQNLSTNSAQSSPANNDAHATIPPKLARDSTQSFRQGPSSINPQQLSSVLREFNSITSSNIYEPAITSLDRHISREKGRQLQVEREQRDVKCSPKTTSPLTKRQLSPSESQDEALKSSSSSVDTASCKTEVYEETKQSSCAIQNSSARPQPLGVTKRQLSPSQSQDESLKSFSSSVDTTSCKTEVFEDTIQSSCAIQNSIARPRPLGESHSPDVKPRLDSQSSTALAVSTRSLQPEESHSPDFNPWLDSQSSTSFVVSTRSLQPEESHSPDVKPPLDSQSSTSLIVSTRSLQLGESHSQDVKPRLDSQSSTAFVVSTPSSQPEESHSPDVNPWLDSQSSTSFVVSTRSLQPEESHSPDVKPPLDSQSSTALVVSTRSLQREESHSPDVEPRLESQSSTALVKSTRSFQPEKRLTVSREKPRSGRQIVNTTVKTPTGPPFAYPTNKKLNTVDYHRYKLQLKYPRLLFTYNANSPASYLASLYRDYITRGLDPIEHPPPRDAIYYHPSEALPRPKYKDDMRIALQIKYPTLFMAVKADGKAMQAFYDRYILGI